MARRNTDAYYAEHHDKTPAIRIDPAYCIIIRSIHCRGERQRLALAELDRRGLWLSAEQKLQAGL
jgi:hypothetical protein